MLFQQVLSDPITGILLLIMLAFALGFHEAAHAYAAHWLGDITPKAQGRLTLNPIKHLDPIGSLFILFAGIGWGKPVMFNPYNLKNPHRDSAVIALAGPAANIALALGTTILLYLLLLGGVEAGSFYMAGFTFIALNVALAIFNLIPIDPLDGFKVVGGLLPPYLARQWYETQAYGVYILMFLLITGMIERLVNPLNKWVLAQLYNLLTSGVYAVFG